MNHQKLLDVILAPSHLEHGLHLEENEDFVELKHEGKVIARFSTAGATPASIRHEADQFLNWKVSGISFEGNLLQVK